MEDKINETLSNGAAKTPDQYKLKSGNASINISKSDITKALRDLEPFKDKQIALLERSIQQKLLNVGETLRLLRIHSPDYPDLFKEVNSKFGSGKVILGTVASLFISCADLSGVPMGCNSKCAITSKSLPDAAECRISVLEYSKGLFNMINNQGTSHAYITIEDKHPSKNEIEKLRDQFGISQVTMITKDGTVTSDTPPPSNYQWVGILVAIVIIVLIILVVILLLKSR